jgi:hypothetical protein
MTEVNTVARSTTHSLRSITLLLAAAAGLAIAGVPSISQGQSRWVTVASTEGAAMTRFRGPFPRRRGRRTAPAHTPRTWRRKSL